MVETYGEDRKKTFGEQIKETGKFIVDDLKSDAKFLKDLADGKAKIKTYKKEELKEAFNLKTIIKENWTWLCIVFLALVVGWFISAKYHQQMCNEFIVANYIKQNISMMLG